MMTLVPFIANAFIASVGAMMMVSTPNKAIGALALTFNGLCAVLCALKAAREAPPLLKPSERGKKK